MAHAVERIMCLSADRAGNDRRDRKRAWLLNVTTRAQFSVACSRVVRYPAGSCTTSRTASRPPRQWKLGTLGARQCNPGVARMRVRDVLLVLQESGFRHKRTTGATGSSKVSSVASAGRSQSRVTKVLTWRDPL